MIKQTYPSDIGEIKSRLLSQPLSRIKSMLPPSCSVTVHHDRITADIGDEGFELSAQQYELEADIEAIIRLAAKRMAI